MTLVAAAVAAISVGLSAPAHAATQSSTHAECRAAYYLNVSGRCVHRPVKAKHVPRGATARCRDKTYSFSEHASGTCSHHGGVAVWIHHP
jgi:hypothetical protein